MLLVGAALIVSALRPRQANWQIKKTPITLPPDLNAFYRPTSLEKWRLHQTETGRRLTVTVAFYADKTGHRHQVLLPEPTSRRWQNWQRLGAYLREHTEQNALILAWWDNGQRIDFLSGRSTWVKHPPAKAFARNDRSLWQRLSGGFDATEDRLVTLARLWTLDSKTAALELSRLAPGKPLYMLINSDDLARLDEIQRLGGKKLPLDLKIFPRSDNFHGQIAAVQAWAQQGGNGYLPQNVPGGIAAWRITGKTNPPLWLLLLPFSSSPKQPPRNLERVFTTDDRNLILYRLKSPQNLP